MNKKKRNKLIEDKIKKEETIKRVLDFQTNGRSSFGDAAEWERNEREDRELPFSK